MAGSLHAQDAPDDAGGATGRPRLSFGLEGKVHFRDSQENRFPVNFPFTPDQLPPGQDRAFLETVNSGAHIEISVVTLYVDAVWSDALTAHGKLDFIDLYERNPTSEDKDVDVDEAWVRFGRESEPAVVPEKPGLYLKVGKLPKFERQDSRHLESYGLVATAFNRLEDIGLEFGADLGRHVYLKLSVTQGNPLFMRDPNALAGDNGTSDFLRPNPDPALKSGILLLYDAEVEDIDLDGKPELGAGFGVRFGDPARRRGVDLLAWGYRRQLAETVDLKGTFYGGDLDLLRGPFNQFPFPISGNEKREVGANLWLRLGDFSLFTQLVDQEVAGLGRRGVELSAAWSFELPLRFALAGRQLFPYVAPAVRYSRIDPDFRNPRQTPTPSFGWDWEKIDLGVRLGIAGNTDLTIEHAHNDFLIGSRHASNDELLTTLRWRL